MAAPKLEEKQEALKLNELGYPKAAIARILNVHSHTVYAWLDPEHLEKRRRHAREYKARRARNCVDCGKKIRYESFRCTACNGKRNGAHLQGKGPQQQRLFEILARDGEARYTNIVNELGISTNHGSVLINHALSRGLIVRVRRGWYALPES